MKHAILQRRAEASAPARIPESVRIVLRQPGQPLPREIRHEMEARFGHDFSRVRIHTNAMAEQSAKETGAAAWTAGRDIAFASNRYRPQTAEGRRLLAHELTHVVQQQEAAVHSNTPLLYGNDAAETEALRMEPPQQNARGIGTNPAAFARQAAAPLDTALQGVSSELQSGAESVILKITEARAQSGQEAVVRVLEETNLSVRRILEPVAQKTHGISLRKVFHESLSGVELVNAFALLSAQSTKEDYVAMGRAILQKTTRNTEIFTLLYNRPLQARRELEKYYAITFAGWGKASQWFAPRHDTLQDHLNFALLTSTWERHKALALLDRDLTDADEVYFNSAALSYAKDEKVIATMRQAWKGSFERFEKLLDHWERHIHGTWGWDKAHAPAHPWCEDPLKDTLKKRLSSTSYEYARTLLSGHENEQSARWQESRMRGTTPAEVRRSTESELLQIAEENNDFDQLRASAEELHNEQKIAGAKEPGEARGQTAKNIAEVRARRKGWILTTRSTAADQAELALIVLFGKPRLSDQAWIAWQRGDLPQVLKPFEDAFATDGAVAFNQHARSRVLGPDGSKIRPAFEPELLIQKGQEPFYSRARLLVSQERPDAASRGAARIAYEFERLEKVVGSKGADPALVDLVSFLGNSHFQPRLRDAMLAVFVKQKGWAKPNAPANAARDFLAGTAEIFENGKGSQFQILRKALQPPATQRQYAQDARAGYNATQTGVAVSFVNVFSDIFDTITGEDTRAVVLESIERLEYIAEKSELSPGDLAQLIALSGVTSSLELAKLDWQLFEPRLRAYRAVQKSTAEAIGGAFEVIVEAALVAATGGVGGWPLINTLISQGANIAAQEALLGSDSHAFSPANARKVAGKFLETGLARIDLRDHISRALHYKEITSLRKLAEGSKSGKTFAKILATTMHNAAAETSNQAILQPVYLALDRLLLQQNITSADLLASARSAFITISGTTLIGAPTTFYNPAVPSDFKTKPADRLKNDIAFTIILKTKDTLVKNTTAWLKDPNFSWDVDTMVQALAVSLARSLVSNVFLTLVESRTSHLKGIDRVAQLNQLIARKGPVYLETLVKEDRRALAAYQAYRAKIDGEHPGAIPSKALSISDWLKKEIAESPSELRYLNKRLTEDAAELAGRRASGGALARPIPAVENPALAANYQ